MTKTLRPRKYAIGLSLVFPYEYMAKDATDAEKKAKEQAYKDILTLLPETVAFRTDYVMPKNPLL